MYIICTESLLQLAGSIDFMLEGQTPLQALALLAPPQTRTPFYPPLS